jgi:hypothetical protein
MSADSNTDELEARKARNDAIRRAREQQKSGETPDATAADDTTPTGPNYVKFIDRKMREGDKPEE